MKKDESPEQAAVRETREEFGITPKKLQCLGCLQSKTKAYLPTMVFLCTDFEGEPKTDSEEMVAPYYGFNDIADLERKDAKLYPAFEDSLTLLEDCINGRSDGGPGSGNWGHVGRPGIKGGSGAGGGIPYRYNTKQANVYTSEAKAWKENKEHGGQGANESHVTNKKKEEKKSEVKKSEVREALEKTSIKNNPVTKRDSAISEQEAIDFVAGGDQTGGSCVSAALAYAGNMLGSEVRDFRGGESRQFFATSDNIKSVLKQSADFTEVKDYNDKNAAISLFNQMEEGKSYILVTGSHCSVAKMENGKAMCLELQSSGKTVNNGWYSLKDRYGTVKKGLTKRFGCESSHKYCGLKWQESSYMASIDSFKGNEEFQNILGYINTAAGKEKKGATGQIK